MPFVYIQLPCSTCPPHHVPWEINKTFCYLILTTCWMLPGTMFESIYTRLLYIHHCTACIYSLSKHILHDVYTVIEGAVRGNTLSTTLSKYYFICRKTPKDRFHSKHRSAADIWDQLQTDHRGNVSNQLLFIRSLLIAIHESTRW